MSSLRLLLAVAVLAVPLAADAADLPSRYTVDEKQLKAALAGTNLTFQLYVQPFVTRGEYSNLRELDNPRAKEYDARYKPFTAITNPGGFNVKQFRSNAVVRWEYRPGSAVYLVWQQGREHYESEFGGRSFGGDFDELFRAHPNNTFLIKMSYWFDR